MVSAGRARLIKSLWDYARPWLRFAGARGFGAAVLGFRFGLF
jgi:hypothetical protein